MLDVHMLVMPANRADWRDQAVASIHAAAAHVDFAVALHLVPGVEGHIGAARAQGFAQGTHDHVTFVDEDDWLDPDAFVVVGAALAGRAGNILTAGRVHDVATGATTLTSRGLLVVERDRAIEFPLADFPLCGTCDLMDAVQPTLIPAAVYHRRDHASSGRALLASRGVMSCRG